MRIYFLFEGREVFSNVVAIHFSSTHFLLTQSHNMKSYLRSYTMCSIHIYEFILYIIGDHTMPRTRSTMETNSSLINMYNTWSIMKWIREKKGYWWTEINYALWHFWLVHQVNSNLYHDSRNRYNIARLLSARVTCYLRFNPLKVSPQNISIQMSVSRITFQLHCLWLHVP